MSNYTQTTNFTALTTAHAVINGAAFDLEYGNVSAAITSKFDNLGGGYTGPFTMNAAAATTTLTVNGVTGYSALKVLTSGIQVGAPTGGELGVGTINVAGGVYINGAIMQPGAPVTLFSTSNPSITIAAANTGFVSTQATLTITIPANASVPFPPGTLLTFQNQGGGNMSIAITSDTLQLANTSTTGTRTLAANGIATAYKTTSTIWIISGSGLS